MAKNAITSYSTTAASNTDVGGVDIQGSAPASNMDDSVREVMSHLAETNAGTAPLADTFCIGDAADLTKKMRFELSGITTATTRVMTVPDADITLVGAAAPSFTTSLTITSTDAGATAGPLLDLRRLSASPAASDIMGTIQFTGNDSGGTATSYALIAANISDPTDTSEDGTLTFSIKKAGTMADILTLNPQGITLTSSTTFNNINTSDDANVLIMTGGNTASQGGQVFVYGDAHATAANDIAFFSQNVEKYRYDASVPVHKFSDSLSVGTFSTTGASAGAQLGDPSFRLNVSSTGTGAASVAVFYNANGQIGSITTSGSATAYNTSSDQRLKRNFRAPPDVGSTIDQIAIYEFDWKGGGIGIGPKAQELHAVFPDAVTPGKGEPGEPDFIPWGWDASKLVPMLVCEVQGLRKRLAALEVRRAGSF